MISLSNDELGAITDAARPLPRKVCSEFLQAAAAERRGPGVVYRALRQAPNDPHHRRGGAPRRTCEMTYQVCKRRRGLVRETQRRFFDPPQFHGSSKVRQSEAAKTAD